MQRKTVVFGNGLGMALNAECFSLDRAIGAVWDDDRTLSDAQKTLICNCLPNNDADRPKGEDELERLQLALSACDFLQGINVAKTHWLSDDGKQFPVAVRMLIYNTAREFHQTKYTLPVGFLDAFCDFIQRTKSHIGTLNYDNLLYKPMIDRGLLQGYDGTLVDGFRGAGFKKENMERKFGKNFGYYLHLHGSPLFVDRGGETIKLSQLALTKQADTISSHIVLTHFEHKPTVIGASKVLLSYWQLLSEAISESEEVILFGYSGCDTHLNSLLRSLPGKTIRVIEWAGAGEKKVRNSFWHKLMARNVDLVQLANIHEFEQWD